MNDKRVTIDDVAAAAGVSRQTVSRAINNLPGISQSTRDHILTLAKTMGYRPSGIARGLANANQRTRTIGVVVPTIDNEFYAAVLHGIEDLTSSHGYNVFLCNTNEDPREEFRKIQSLFSLWIDGLIICSSRLDDQALREIARQFRPVILLNREFHHPHVGNVLINDTQGTEEAVTHLIHQGHTRIGMMLGMPVSRSSENRRIGYENAMRAASLAIQPDWLLHTGAHLDAAYHAGKAFLQSHPALTALVVYNDVRAAGVLRACAELGIPVPGQLSIVSHDNITLSSLVIPSLTTVDIPKYEMGRSGALMMLAMLNDKNLQPDTIRLSPHLIVRESSQTITP